MQDIPGINRPGAIEIVVAETTADDDNLVLYQQMSKFLERLAEQADFDAPAAVVENDAYTVAAFAYINNQAGHSNFTTYLCRSAVARRSLGRRFCCEVRESSIDKKPCVFAKRIKRVSGQVKTQRLSFIAQQQPLLPLAHVDELRCFSVGFGSIQPKHVILPSRRSACVLLGTPGCFRRLMQQRSTREAEFIHGPGLDHRFECATIHFVVVNAATKFVQVRERAAANAFIDQ